MGHPITVSGTICEGFYMVRPFNFGYFALSDNHYQKPQEG